MVALTVGRPGNDHVVLQIERRLFPQASDAWDGNALGCRVSLRVGGFIGEFATTMWANDFYRFLVELRGLNQTLDGSADFETAEGQVSLAIASVSSLGTLRVSGSARDVAGIGNRLDFELSEFDQTDLPSLIRTLEEISTAYPVVGREASN